MNDHSSPAVYHERSLDLGCAVNGDADDCTKRRKELSERASGGGHRQVMKKPGWSSSKRPRRLVISLSRRLSGLVIVLKLEASILPKPSHDSREHCSAPEDYRYAREDCIAKYCAREGCTPKDYASRRKTMREEPIRGRGAAADFI